MSKKNKIQKQLLRAQIERNAQALSSGKSLDQASSVTSISSQTVPATSGIVSSMPKDNTEFSLIKKDIFFSISLIVAVIVAFLAIYLIDRNTHFLLPLANKIFTLLQK